jgi:serine/threonine protein phosphatase PrpC
MESLSSAACPACSLAIEAADNFCETCGREFTPAVVSTGSAKSAGCRGCLSPHITADGYCEQCGHRAASGRDHVELDVRVAAGVTDRGLRHHRNEDAMALAVTATVAGPAALAVVCDGVSTSDRPDEASLSAAATAISILVASVRTGTSEEEALTAAVLGADSAVRDLAGQSANAPAATYVSGVVTAEAVTVCWIGDSRAYWLPADTTAGARQLTRDDSVAGELVAAGLLAEADAMASPDGHVVTSWLGADADAPEPHLARLEPRGPGIVLLCSDGLWNYQPEPGNLSRLALPRALEDLSGAAADLLASALEAGGHDNITVVLIAYPPGNGGAAIIERSTPE